MNLRPEVACDLVAESPRPERESGEGNVPPVLLAKGIQLVPMLLWERDNALMVGSVSLPQLPRHSFDHRLIECMARDHFADRFPGV